MLQPACNIPAGLITAAFMTRYRKIVNEVCISFKLLNRTEIEINKRTVSLNKFDESLVHHYPVIRCFVVLFFCKQVKKNAEHQIKSHASNPFDACSNFHTNLLTFKFCLVIFTTG